jgi:SAM-dependent methyltransferase
MTQPGVHARVLRWFPGSRPITVLDAGAGEGALSQALAQAGHRVVACDADASNFRTSRVPFIRASLERPLPFESCSFDAVVSTEVLEHLENPHHVAREFARVLKPGGMLVVTTPNIINVYSRLHFLLLGTCDYFDTLSGSRETAFHGTKGHINPVGFPELRFALEQVGLKVVEVATNRDIRAAIQNGSWKMRLVGWFLGPLGAFVKWATYATRRTDDVALAMLDRALVYGEDLIVRAERVA